MPEPESVLELLQWDPATGALSLDGGRYLLIRPETLAGIQWAAERQAGFEGARELLVAGGSLGGGKAARKYAGDAKPDVRALAERMASRGTAIGWGRLAVESVSADEVVFTAIGSPFAAAYGGSERPVCHILAGALEGFGRNALSPDARAEETECTAAGAPACRFRVRASVA